MSNSRRDSPGQHDDTGPFLSLNSIEFRGQIGDRAQSGGAARAGLGKEGAQRVESSMGRLGAEEEGVADQAVAEQEGDHLSSKEGYAREQSHRPPISTANRISSDAKTIAFPTSTSPFPSPSESHQAPFPQQQPYHQLPPVFFVPVTYGPPPPPFLSPPPPGFIYPPTAFFGPPLPPPLMYHIPPHLHESVTPPRSADQPSQLPDFVPPRIHHSPSLPDLHHPPYHQYPFTEQHHREAACATAEELFGPPPCAVWNCFRPTFCELAPCGCRICREHLGKVIRGAKIEAEQGVEGEAKKKRFECVACRAKSHTMGPASCETSSPVEIDAAGGASNGSMKARSGTTSDASLFSISFRAPAARFPSRLGDGSSSSSSSTPTSSSSLPHRISFPTVLALPPPPPYEPLAHRTRAVSSPPASATTDRISFPPRSPIISKPKKKRSFNATGITVLRPGPPENLSGLDLVESKEENGSHRRDWRRPMIDPCEPYQLEKGDWPIVKVENIPFSTTVKDLEAWLPVNSLPSPEIVVSSIHIILHRPTGRTLPHCYLEMASQEVAVKAIESLDRSHLGDRTVRVKWQRPGELMRDEDYFVVPCRSPAAAPLPRFAGNYKLPSQIINESDIKKLLAFCQSPPRTLPWERPFLNIISILAKFPWASEELWNEEQRYSLFECVLEAMGIAARFSVEEPLLHSLVQKMRTATLSCPGFTEMQKEKIKAFRPDDHTSSEPPTPLEELFPPLVSPPSPAAPLKVRTSTLASRKPVPPSSPPMYRRDNVWHKGIRISASIESFELDRAGPETPPHTPASKDVKFPRREAPKRAGRSRGGWGLGGEFAEAEWVEGVVDS